MKNRVVVVRVVEVGVAVVLLVAVLSVGALAGSGRLPWGTYQELLRWETLGPYEQFAPEKEVELLLLIDGPLTQERIAELHSARLEVTAAVGETVVVKGPLSKLVPLAPDGEALAWVRMALEPVPTLAATAPIGRSCYAIKMEQALNAIGGDRLHELDYRGQGVKIGVIDGGFTGALAEHLGTERVHYLKVAYRDPKDPEKPGSPYFAHGFKQDGLHGEACAQAIADIAPEAEFFLLSAPRIEDRKAIWQLILDDQLVLGDQAIKLDVISESIYTSIPFDFNDGRGDLAQLADRVVRERGIFYAYAVGNLANGEDTDRTFYEAVFQDKDHNKLHDFTPESPSVRDRNLLDIHVKVAEGETAKLVLALTWDGWPWILDEHELPQQDLDLRLYCLSPAGGLEIVKLSEYEQCFYPDMEPLEIIGVEIDSTCTYKVAVLNVSKEYCAVERPTTFHLYVYTSGASFAAEHHTVEGSLINLGGARAVTAVGAVCWDGLLDWVNFPPSSQGPTTDGRIKADLVAPTGYISSVLDRPFGGTSASAPLVAGAAALLCQAYPSATAYTISEALQKTASNLGEEGCDNTYGCGLINVWAAYEYLKDR